MFHLDHLFLIRDLQIQGRERRQRQGFFAFSQKTDTRKASLYFSPEKLAMLLLLKGINLSPEAISDKYSHI